MRKITKQELLNEKMNMPTQGGLPSFNDVYNDLQKYFKKENKSVETEVEEGKLFTKLIRNGGK